MFIYRWWTGQQHAALKPKSSFTEDEPALDSNTDALAEFNKLLEAEKAKISGLMNEWMEHKKDVIGKDIPDTEHEHHTSCSIETEDKVKSTVKLFFEKIKAIFQSAKANMEGQLRKEINEHMRPLRLHIDELCAAVNDETKSDDERRDVAIHICNTSIVLLREMEGLTSNVADEIKYCLDAEAKEEAALKLAINAGILLLSSLVGVILPPVDFDLREKYRNFLSDEIQDPESQYIREVAESEGELKKAGHFVEDYAAKLKSSGGIFKQPVAVNDASQENKLAVTLK